MNLAYLAVLPAAYLLLVADATRLLIYASAALFVLAIAWVGVSRLDEMEEGL